MDKIIIFLVLTYALLVINSQNSHLVNGHAIEYKDELLNNEQINCIILELNRIGEQDPESANLIKRIVHVFNDLSDELRNCKTESCKLHAHYKAFNRLKKLEEEANETPGLTAKIESVIESCRENHDVHLNDITVNFELPGPITQDQIDCVKDELQKFGVDYPEYLEWSQRAISIFAELSEQFNSCSTQLCRLHAQLEAFKHFYRLHRELEANPELLEHIRKIEQTCRSKLGLSGKSHADNVIKIEVPDEAVPCIRDGIDSVRNEHPENEEFQHWALGTMADFENFAHDFHECKGGSFCRRKIEIRAIIRYRRAMRDLKKIDKDGNLRAEIDEALKPCYAMIEW